MRHLITLAEAVLYSGQTNIGEYRNADITIWENPSRAEFAKAMKASEYGSLRGLWGVGLIIWDADKATHYDMIEWVGDNMSTVIDGADLEFFPDYVVMNSFAPDIYDVNDPATIQEAEQMAATIRKTFQKFYATPLRVHLMFDGTREEMIIHPS